MLLKILYFLTLHAIVPSKAAKLKKDMDVKEVKVEVSITRLTSADTVNELRKLIYTENAENQVLLLICDNSRRYTFCRQFPAWLESFQNESVQKWRNLDRNNSIEIGPEDDLLKFYATSNKDFADEFLPDSSKENMDIYAFPALIYIASGRAFLYPGRLDDNTSLSHWLNNFKNSISADIDYANLDKVLNRIGKSDNKLLLLMYDSGLRPKSCKVNLKLWQNLARSLSDYAEVSVGHVDLAEGTSEILKDSATRVEIQQRFDATNLKKACPSILLIQRKWYRMYETRYPIQALKTETKDIRRFVRKSDINSTEQEGTWWPIRRPLTDVELLYRIEESRMDRERRKLSFVMVGATGGLGVIVLAISIFWGLKTSDTVKQ